MLASSTCEIHNFSDQTVQQFSVPHLSVFIVEKTNAISDSDGSVSLRLYTTICFIIFKVLRCTTKNLVVLHCFMIG
jgi:hypothetical protein